ncbi:MAG: 4Fe-4S dicluster domain-containing protein [Deltaproteobacteria bacterium]|nr:4Fe-4S dicluster domain-containing protein [Deltaproteobacteria bacterium]
MKSIDKKDVIDMLKDWTNEYHVLCPNKKINDDCIFDGFEQDHFTLDYGKLSFCLKSAFFPQSEIIFEVEDNQYHEVISSEKTILFGIRACDMMGILQSSSFMSRDYGDVYYSAKDDATIKVVMACPGPQNETCFCTTTNSGPFAEKGFDLQFFDMGEEFLVEVGSKKGKELISGELFTDIDSGDAKGKIAAFKKKASEAIPKVDEIKSVMEMLKNGVVEDEEWEEFGQKCIACGGCAFVCPTCTCFNVYDLARDGSGMRVRGWDTCLYGGFTREASMHNPRPTQGSRLKRRYEHKLKDYNEQDLQGGLCTCVGCGRCSDVCPVDIGILNLVLAISRDYKSG